MPQQAPAVAPELIALLQNAGWRPPDFLTHPDLLQSTHELLELTRSDPMACVLQALRERRRADEAGRQSAKAVDQVGKLEKLLEGLLDTQPMLCRLEGLHCDGRGKPRALCRIGSQLRHLTIHPKVVVEELERLEPWQFVCVDPDTMIVVGTCNDEGLFLRSQGEVVEFKGWQDRARGLVRVVRSGHEEAVVELCSGLRGRELRPPTKLVLMRDDPRWAIEVVENEFATSRFEVPLAGITTRFEDLAGLDRVIEPLVEDSVLRLLEPEIRARFDLRPMRGLLFFSYKPGMGKTALVRAFARWLHELGEERGFDVVLYLVKPNELKNMMHGGDAKLVREDLCGSIRARQSLPRSRPLFQLVVLDEIDSLGRRAGPESITGVLSGAHDDAVQALLAEMDGMVQEGELDQRRGLPPAHVLYIGLTNRPEKLDEALKRPGRFGDHVAEMPETTVDAAVGICAVHARCVTLPWFRGGEIRALAENEVRESFLRPALARVFDAVVLRYATEGRPALTEVTAGRALAGVHYMEAMNAAKKAAARREFLGEGLPAITLEDVLDGLVGQAASVARQMEADHVMLARQLRIQGRVTRVETVPDGELCAHRFLAEDVTAEDVSAEDITAQAGT